MTRLYLDIDEYVELTEEEAVDIALRLMLPPPKEEFLYYESEINGRERQGYAKRNKKRNIL